MKQGGKCMSYLTSWENKKGNTNIQENVKNKQTSNIALKANTITR
jgi:hypothetical protein